MEFLAYCLQREIGLYIAFAAQIALLIRFILIGRLLDVKQNPSLTVKIPKLRQI
jgi:hypothetical protein